MFVQQPPHHHNVAFFSPLHAVPSVQIFHADIFVIVPDNMTYILTKSLPSRWFF